MRVSWTFFSTVNHKLAFGGFQFAFFATHSGPRSLASQSLGLLTEARLSGIAAREPVSRRQTLSAFYAP